MTQALPPRPVADLARLGFSAIAPGAWRIALPFPSPLQYSLSYLLTYDKAVVAVDLGWDDDICWELFCRGLSNAALSLDDLTGVVFTHAHPDHYGLAGRVHDHSDAWLALHPSEQPQIATTGRDRESRVQDIESWLVECGVPVEDLGLLLADREQLSADMSSQSPDRGLSDGEAIPGTNGGLVAIHTPGHTPGHNVFHDRQRNLLFTGDHVLPRVTPNISQRPTSGPEPLGDYLSSLTKIEALDGALVQPGHEWSFDALGTRLQGLLGHHQGRLNEIENAVRAGNDTVWAVANVVTWGRPLASLNPRGIRSALGETASHLARLAATGAIVRDPGRPTRWRR